MLTHHKLAVLLLCRHNGAILSYVFGVTGAKDSYSAAWIWAMVSKDYPCQIKG